MIKELCHDEAILSQCCEVATVEDESVAQDLIDTIKSLEDAGCLAANQIGVTKKVCVYLDDAGEPHVLYNPRLVFGLGASKMEESCLTHEEITKSTRYIKCKVAFDQIVDGKMKEFRSEGGIVKTEREKSEMAQKHRFKKEREFKKRVSEETENEEADIRSFQFHSHRLEDFEKRRNEIRRGGRPRVGAGGRRDDDDDRKGGRSFGGKRGGDRNDRNNKRGGFKGDRRGGKNFGGKRGSKPSFDTDFDDED